MKLWMWITISILFVLVIAYAINVRNKTKAEEARNAEIAANIAASKQTKSTGSSNIWTVLSGISSIMGNAQTGIS